MSDPFNVVLITVDAWRADFVSSFEGIPLVSAIEGHPKAARFERAYANAPWTSPALVSIHTGQPPTEHGVHYAWSSPSPRSPAVAKVLAERGWSCPNLVYLNGLDNYINLGYERAEAPAYPRSPEDDPLIPALSNTPEPYFLWFHYKWIHLPWWAPQAHREALGIDPEAIPPRVRDSVASQFVVPHDQFTLRAEDQDLVRRLYASSVRHMNDWLARVLDAIDSGPARERTSVVLTADHGDELLEHGHVGHASTAQRGTLFEEVLRIPLIVLDPRISAPRRVATRVQALDLFATLLSLAGVEAPLRGAPQSLDLTPAIFGDPDALAAYGGRPFSFHSGRAGYLTPRAQEGHVIRGISDGELKLIETRYGGLERAIYDLGADPGEIAPLREADLRGRGSSWPQWLVDALSELG